MFPFLKNLTRLLSPTPPIAGLEISDAHVRFFFARRDKFTRLEMRLAPGVVQDGKVTNAEELTNAFKKLTAKLKRRERKNLHAVVSIHSSGAYLQTFDLPYLVGNKLKEAAELNLRTIAPMPFEEAYADWDLLGEDAATGSLKILGAFTEKTNVEHILEACRSVGIVVVAVEPSILSLARSVTHELETRETKKESFVLVHVSSDGIDFAGVKNGKVHFDYFVSWLSMYAGATEIAPEVFRSTIVRHVEQVLNFAASHGDFSRSEVVLVASEFKEEIPRILQERFKISVTILDAFGDRTPDVSYGVTYGSYLRGLIPRSKDAYISLMSVGTEEEFKQSQTLFFIKWWRDIVGAFGVSLALIFGLSFFFIDALAERAGSEPPPPWSAEDTRALETLRAKARQFNAAVQAAGAERGGFTAASPYLEALSGALPGTVTLTRVAFQSASTPLVINGIAASENALSTFRAAIEAAPEFQLADLPLSSISPVTGGFSFLMRVTPNPAP